LALFYTYEFYALDEPNGLKEQEMSKSKNNLQTIKEIIHTRKISSMMDVRSHLSKEIGIPVAVQGRKSSILC